MIEIKETLTQKVQRFAREYIVGGLSEEEKLQIYEEKKIYTMNRGYSLSEAPRTREVTNKSIVTNAALGVAAVVGAFGAVYADIPPSIVLPLEAVGMLLAGESFYRWAEMGNGKDNRNIACVSENARGSITVLGLRAVPAILGKIVSSVYGYAAQKGRNLALVIEYDFEDTPYAERELPSTTLAELIQSYNDGTKGYVRLERRSKWENYGYCDHFQPSGSSHQTEEKENTNLGDFLQEEFGDNLKRGWVPFWEPLQGTIKVRSYKSKNGQAEKHVLEMNERWGYHKGEYGLTTDETIVREDMKITYLVETGRRGD